MTRLAPALRLQFVAWPAALTWPWLVLAAALAVNVGIFASIVPDGESTTGGLSSIYLCTAILYIFTMTQMFPFALGLSLTRRAFHAAMTTMAVGQALASGVALYLLKLIESATNGWGVGLEFFRVGFMVVDNPILQILVYAGPFLLMAFGGIVVGVIYKRWGQTGIWILGIAGMLIVGGLAILMTWQGWWAPFGRWFADQSPAALFVGYCPLLAAVLGGLGYLLTRRASA